jgi:hypothetical protein
MVTQSDTPTKGNKSNRLYTSIKILKKSLLLHGKEEEVAKGEKNVGTAAESDEQPEFYQGMKMINL